MVSKVLFAEILIIFLIKSVHSNCSEGTPSATIPPKDYPNARRDEKVQDVYDGQTIKDPYRWLENPDCPETKEFIKQEMGITKPYLEKSPFRPELQERYKSLYDYAKYTGPMAKGKKFFSFQNTGLQNQDVFFVQDSLTSKPEVFLDPNTLCANGTVSLEKDYYSFSNDGQIFAYLLSESGSDWKTGYFKHVEKGNIYKDQLTKIKFTTLAWTKDGTGVFYAAYLDQKGKAVGSDNEANQNCKIYYHVLGTDQSKDIMVAEYSENPDYFLSPIVSDCGKYLIVIISEGCDHNIVYIADLEKVKCEIKGKLDLIPIITKMDSNYYYIANNDNIFYFHTNKDADNYKIISIDVTNPDPKSWKDVVPENEKNKLDWVWAAYDKYTVLGYIENVKTVIQLHDITSGKMIKKFDLEVGSVENEKVFCDRRTPHLFFNLESFLTPGMTYHVDLSKSSFDLEVYHEIKLKNFDKEKYTIEQVFYKSKDGTQVPMYLVYKKGLQKTGNNFAFLYAYGGFGISMLPYFTVNRLVVISNFDGVHCVANIRGGGELGEKWHRDGSLNKKQNCFDDFAAAAEYLIAQKYTNSKLLAINGGSNGGLLMGASLNQRPELFGVVIADVGVMDMLRFDKFTCGHAWITEYGTPSNPKDFPYLIKYSPLHNIKICEDRLYPATMLTTSDHDDRVPPLHSLKFIATLQFEAKNQPKQINPLIIRVETDAGHGHGKPTDKIISEYVDMMCFIVLNTGIKFKPSC